MSIEVIGAGFGRTGTMSLKHALEELGYNKTHHMIEMIENPYQFPYWKEMLLENKTDIDAMMKGYKAIVDLPGVFVYKELMEKYPDAKLILTLRDPEKWYKSANDTIYNIPRGFDRFMMHIVGFFKPDVGYIAKVMSFIDSYVWKGFFEGKFKDKTFAIDRFNKWNEDVIKYVPADKLLVMEVKEGWEPLCKFLNKPIPSTPFPHVNDTAEFQARVKEKSGK